MKTTLFIPVLNEIEGIKLIMPRVKKEWVDEIIIVDGHSTDGTKEWLEEHGFKVLSQKTPGILNAWWEGFEASSGDILIPFSPDNNSIPELIPVLISKMLEGYDMVIASRYKKGAKSEDDDFITAFGNFIFTKIINILFGASYTDTLGMYRAFRRSLITVLKLDEHKNDIFEVLISIRCAKEKLKVMEIPGDEPKRIGAGYSRAWVGIRGKIKGGSMMLKCILREFFSRQ